jgi:NAD(P)-dependent dehydrogenase (short-subunit alcohol dehydrogenase family)
MDFLQVFAAKRGWGDDTDRAAEYILKGCGQTVNRLGQVEDVAYAVACLASPRGDFLNGLNIHLDGGGTASIYQRRSHTRGRCGSENIPRVA